MPKGAENGRPPEIYGDSLYSKGVHRTFDCPAPSMRKFAELERLRLPGEGSVPCQDG